MTEELEKEAREDVDSLNGVDLVSSTIVGIDRYGAYKIGRYDGYLAGAEPREKRIVELEAENERIKTKYYELQDTLKKVRLALIKERTANIMNYGKGGVEMFDSMFEILKGVSN